ncbi:hypothetical protein M5689_001130 [Euphorbia peplus]|nr:hypothetical protein M5689_001130 [Euphorbia peplus]
MHVLKDCIVWIDDQVTYCSQLTRLELESCTSLQRLPSSIGELQLLQYLNLEGCSKLVNLPDSTCSLKALKSLFIKECKNVKKLPENIGNLKSEISSGT